MKPEVPWESLDVVLHLFIQSFDFNTIAYSQIRIQHYLNVSDGVDSMLNFINRYQFIPLGMFIDILAYGITILHCAD